MDLTERFPKCQSYPPAPDWYSPNAIAVAEPHFFMYASKKLIIILDLSQLRYINSFLASAEKVTAIAAHDTFCFTAGVDKKVRIWNVLLGSLLATFDNHKVEVTALKLIREGTICISGDKSGKIVLIDPSVKAHTKEHAKVKSEITCMATTTVANKDYVAVGYANGMIFIEEIGQDLSMTTVFQLSDENDSIQSLSWQHQPSDSEEKWPLLASIAKRRKFVSIWAFPDQSKYASFQLPHSPVQATEYQKSSLWIELSWSPSYFNKLYFSSYLGHIHCFDLSTSKPKICPGDKLEKHNRNVFTINWFNNGRHCITTSLDNRIIKWDVQKKSCLQILRTQATYPYAIDTPSWNEGQLAIGMGDCTIKLWTFANTSSVMKKKVAHDYYSADVFWKGLQGKIEKIKWHPTREGLIAFGNEYGRVGLFDTLNSKSTNFKICHMAQTAPCVDWSGDLAEALEEPGMNDTLISLGGDGIMHVYDTNHPNELPVNLNDRLREKNDPWFVVLGATHTSRTALKIDERYNFLAIGHSNGLVEVYELDSLKVIFASNFQTERIACLDWKYLDGKVILASGCSKGIVAVYDITRPDNIPDVPVAQNEPLRILVGHQAGIVDIKWSRHRDRLILATAALDSLVAVWDVMNRTSIGLFDRHRAGALSVCWNQVDENVLFSSGMDRFIYEWCYLDYPYDIHNHKPFHDMEKVKFRQNPNDNKRKAETTMESKKKQKTATKKQNSSDPSSLLASIESENATDYSQKEKYCLQLADKILNNQVTKAIDHIKNTYLEDHHIKDPNVLTYTKLFDQEFIQEKKHKNIHDLLYGDKNDIRQLVELEVSYIDQQNTSTQSDISFAVQNNVRKSVDTKLAFDIMHAEFSMFQKSSIDSSTNSCLTDWILLAFSPMIGKEKWIELMLKQAQKLESLKQFHLSACCYIACSQIYDAVELYRRHGMFREAIVLAKLRLPSFEPMVESLFGDWAKELQKGTQYTLTAICYLLSNIPGSTNNAIGALARSGEESALFSAACLAVAVNETTKDQRIERWLNKLNGRLKQ